MSSEVAAGILAERRREYTASLDRFDKAVTDVDRLISWSTVPSTRARPTSPTGCSSSCRKPSRPPPLARSVPMLPATPSPTDGRS
jgi:hypothetical protein